jgi:hypothetical protein
MRRIATAGVLFGLAAAASAQSERVTIPAAASLVGVAPFFSDVRVLNTSYSAPLHVKGTYRCFIGACPSPAPEVHFELAPREARALDDIAADAFDSPDSAGGVEFEEESGGSVADLVVTSRLYSTAPTPTVGMFIPGVRPGAAHRYGVLTQIANGGSGLGFRTNVGAFNPQDVPATAVFAVYWQGHWVGQVERTIPARSGVQINNIFGSDGINHPDLETSDGVVTVQTNGPAIFSYAAVIDNQTTDPIFVSAAEDVAPVLSVGGVSDTHVTLGENTCTPVPPVMDNPTTVVQTPGAHAMSLTHAGITYDGTVEDDGSFSMQPETVGQFTITITGQFTPQGFTASVRVEQAAPACFYIVDWNGLKQDGSNFFP